MSPLTEHAQSNGSTVVSGIRTSLILSPGRMVRPTSLSSNTNPSDQSSSEVVKLQYTGRFDTSCQIRPSMVDISLTNTTGESYCSTNSRFDHLFGCFPARVGSVLRLQPNGRLLEQDRISGPYQHIRTPSSLLCTQVLSGKSDQQGHLPQNGQYHGSFVLEQHGRHSLPPAPSPRIRDLGLVLKEKSISSGTTHPQQEERRSGYRVASKARSERLDVASKSDSASDPTLHGGSLCLTPISSTWQVCQLETRPERISQRCVHAGLVESDSICLPTVQSTPSRTSQNQKGACNASVSSSNMDSTTLVAPTDRTYCGLPGISGEQSPIAAGCDRARSDTPYVPLVEVSRMENIRRRYETMGISEKAVELLCKNVKSSTTKTYNVSWVRKGKVIPYHVQCLTF